MTAEVSVRKASTRVALQHKRSKGERVGQVPFGFDVAGDGVHLIENEREQNALQFISELRASGLTWQKVADELNERGVSPKRAARWSMQTARLVGRQVRVNKRPDRNMDCFLCGEKTGTRGEWDHFPIPKALAGVDVVPLCCSCHDMKDRIPVSKWAVVETLSGIRALIEDVRPGPGRVLVAKLAAVTGQQAALIDKLMDRVEKLTA